MPHTPTKSTLVHTLDRAFTGSAWHGATLLRSLRGVNLDKAAWRPYRDWHNIWELVVHAAYWKYRVYLRLTDKPPRSFALKGTNWYDRPVEQTEEAWQTDKELLKDWHRRLKEAVQSFCVEQLTDHPGKSKYTYEDFITGIAAHDVYHTGQIQLLKKHFSRIDTN